MKGFIYDLEQDFELFRNNNIRKKMQSEISDQFEFYGIDTPLRNEIENRLMSKHQKELDDYALEICTNLYDKEAREFQYTAIEILKKYHKKIDKVDHLSFLRNFFEHKAAADTIDPLATFVLRNYLDALPEVKGIVMNFLLLSQKPWKNRSGIIFQVLKKEKTEEELLFANCKMFKKSTDPIILDAIKMALEAYSEIKPDAVQEFLSKNRFDFSIVNEIQMTIAKSKKKQFTS